MLATWPAWKGNKDAKDDLEKPQKQSSGVRSPESGPDPNQTEPQTWQVGLGVGNFSVLPSSGNIQQTPRCIPFWHFYRIYRISFSHTSG